MMANLEGNLKRAETGDSQSSLNSQSSLDVLRSEYKRLDELLQSKNPYRATALNELNQEMNKQLPEILSRHKGAGNERAVTLDSIYTYLNGIRNKLDEMSLRYGDNPVFQVIDRDTQRDMERIPVMISDLDAPPEQRRQERKIWQRQKQADKLAFNDLEESRVWEDRVRSIPPGNYIVKASNVLLRPTGKSLRSANNRLRHEKGHKLQQTYGSAELQNIEKREFRGRDGDISQLQIWLAALYRRTNALENLEKDPETKYISRYKALEGTQRLAPEDLLPWAKKAHREANREVKEATREIKIALRESNDTQRISELYSRLGNRELEKWQHLLEKEYRSRQGTRKVDRTTTFEELGDTHLTQLLEEANKQLEVRRHALTFIKLVKAGKRPEAIENIPEHLCESVFQELDTVSSSGEVPVTFFQRVWQGKPAPISRDDG